MVDKIVELENGKNYVLLDESILDSKRYYFGLRLDSNNEPTNNYLFFQELVDVDGTFLTPIEDEKVKGVLLTSFTVNYVDKVYDEV